LWVQVPELFLLLPVVKPRAQKPEVTKQVEWPLEERKPEE
jgi:hypothetical protein